MAKITMAVENRTLVRLHRELAQVPDRVRDGAKAAVDESGEAVRDQVERTVRVRTGRLRNKIRVRLIGARGLTADVGWFDQDTYYSHFQEFGTSRISADPVLTRAAEEEKGRFAKRVRTHVSENL